MPQLHRQRATEAGERVGLCGCVVQQEGPAIPDRSLGGPPGGGIPVETRRRGEGPREAGAGQVLQARCSWETGRRQQAWTLREAGRKGCTAGIGPGRTFPHSPSEEQESGLLASHPPHPRSEPLFGRKARVPISKGGKGLLRLTRASSSELEALRGQVRAQGARGLSAGRPGGPGFPLTCPTSLDTTTPLQKFRPLYCSPGEYHEVGGKKLLISGIIEVFRPFKPVWINPTTHE